MIAQPCRAGSQAGQVVIFFAQFVKFITCFDEPLIRGRNSFAVQQPEERRRRFISLRCRLAGKKFSQKWSGRLSRPEGERDLNTDFPKTLPQSLPLDRNSLAVDKNHQARRQVG